MIVVNPTVGMVMEPIRQIPFAYWDDAEGGDSYSHGFPHNPLKKLVPTLCVAVNRHAILTHLGG